MNVLFTFVQFPPCIHWLVLSLSRSSRPQCFTNKVLKKLTKFTGKNLCWCFPANLCLVFPTPVFSCENFKSLFTEHLWWLLRFQVTLKLPLELILHACSAYRSSSIKLYFDKLLASKVIPVTSFTKYVQHSYVWLTNLMNSHWFW